jgi:formate dehydrogenase, alpha subunit
MTNSVNEVFKTDLMFVIGSNTTEAHPIIGNKMQQAHRKGKKLIVVDPRKTELAREADLHISLKSGTDAALINGIMHIIIEEELYAKEYVESKVERFEEVKELVSKYNPELVSKITTVPVDQIYEAARMYANAERAGIFYTLGITEHTTGTSNVMNLSNLALLCGNIGIEGAGINPLRGQNNVQGACDMAALPNYFPGYHKVLEEENVKKFEEHWNCTLNRKMGLRIPEMLDGAAEGSVKAMYIMGEDPVLSDPDANHVKHAINSLDFLVVQDINMTETAKLADVVLPATCYAEKDGTFTASERRVQRVRKAVEAPGQARIDWTILAEVSKRLGGHGFDWKCAEDIFNEIRKCIPNYSGISYEKIDRLNGVQWPCTSEDHEGSKYLHKGKFARGERALMVPVEYEGPKELENDEYPIILSTGRALYHYNVMTRYSNALDGILPHELVEICAEDSAKYGLEDGDFMRVTSRRGSVVGRAKITERVKPGLIYMTFHFSETPVNQLTSAHYDPITKTAEYKVTAVNIKKVNKLDKELESEKFVDLNELVEEIV